MCNCNSRVIVICFCELYDLVIVGLKDFIPKQCKEHLVCYVVSILGGLTYVIVWNLFLLLLEEKPISIRNH